MFLTNQMKGLVKAEVEATGEDYLQALHNIIHEEWVRVGEKYRPTCTNILGVEPHKDWQYDDYGNYKPEVAVAIKAYEKYDWNYDDAVEYAELYGGPLAAFAFLLGKYYYQVGNGGHTQYWDNGYASTIDKKYHGPSNMNLHEKMCKYFDEMLEAGVLTKHAKMFRTIANAYLKKTENMYYIGDWSGAYGPGDDRMYDTEIGAKTIEWINEWLEVEAGQYKEYVEKAA